MINCHREGKQRSLKDSVLEFSGLPVVVCLLIFAYSIWLVPTASSRKIVLFDDVGAGHHLFQVSGLDFLIHQMSGTSFVPIPPSEFGGVITVNIFAILSTLGLVSVALRITWLLIRRYLLLTASEVPECVFFTTQLGQYVACLLISMVFSSTSGIIGISWLAQRGITEGWVCRLQATLMQIATWSTAYFTVSIAIHTFNSLVLKRRQSVILCRSTMCIGWVTATVAGLMPSLIHPPDGYVYGVADGLTCGIRSVYPKLIFWFHLFPILIGSLLSAIFYSLVFLVLRGTLEIRDGIKLTLNPDERQKNRKEKYYESFIARVAESMVWYPVAYVALLLPYSIMHLLDISGFVVPFNVTIIGLVCWYNLSIVDVLLVYNTFRLLSPVFDAFFASVRTRKDMEFFYATEDSQQSEYLAPRAPSTGWGKKNNQYSRPDFCVPFHLGQSLTIEPKISPSIGHLNFDYSRTITPPLPALLSSRPDMEGLPPPSRFATVLPKQRQSQGIRSSNERVIIRQQPRQTLGHQEPAQSRTSS